MLDDVNFTRQLRLDGFDLMFLEMFHFCPIGIAELAGIHKVVLASNLGMTMTHIQVNGLDIKLSQTPGGFSAALSNAFSVFMSAYGTKMKFTERVYNVLSYFVQKVFFIRTYYSQQYLFSQYFNYFSDLLDLFHEKTTHVLLNLNEFTDPAPVLPHNVKHIGGATIRNTRLLSQVSIFSFSNW